MKNSQRLNRIFLCSRNFLLVCVTSFALCSANEGGSDPIALERARLQKSIDSAKTVYHKKLDQFRSITEQRWSEKESQTLRKAENKDKLERIRQNLELKYGEISRAKEEMLLGRQQIEEVQLEASERREQWSFLAGQVDDKLNQLSKRNRQGFPIDLEKRMAQIGAIQSEYVGSRFAIQKMKALLDLRNSWVSQSASLGIGRRTFLGESGKPITAEVLRIGNASAFGLTPDGELYGLGRVGASTISTFEWQRILQSETVLNFRKQFPNWIRQGEIAGYLSMDLLQNKQSKALLTRGEKNLQEKAIDFAKAGGPVMFPLGGILLWALGLILWRIVNLFLLRRKQTALVKKLLPLLIKGKESSALDLLVGKKGFQADLLRLCLNAHGKSREWIEKKVTDRFTMEMPRLNKSLDTLAVLAAAAPLLGLLGTVTGMITLFESITRFGTSDPKLMAGGISEALVTTEVGLILAIPILLIHNWLKGRRNAIVDQAEINTLKVIHILWGDKVAPVAAAPSENGQSKLAEKAEAAA